MAPGPPGEQDPCRGVIRRVKWALGRAVKMNRHLCQVEAHAPGSQEATFPVASPVPSPGAPAPSVEIPWLEKCQQLGPLGEVTINPQQWFSVGVGVGGHWAVPRDICGCYIRGMSQASSRGGPGKLPTPCEDQVSPTTKGHLSPKS